jgi:hypothetical protein
MTAMVPAGAEPEPAGLPAPPGTPTPGEAPSPPGVTPGVHLLDMVAVAARAAVLARFERTSCIATTRVVIEAARYFGVDAHPWAVNVKVFNAAAWDLACQQVDLTEWPPDAWSVSIHVDNGGDRIGHLVAVTRHDLIDASIDQAERPTHGIPHLPPIVADLPDSFDPAARSAYLGYQADDGVRVFYTPSGSRRYATSSNWRRDRPDIRACVAETIRIVNHARQLGAVTP